jgi:uncharacterized protein YbdZ (MbtH family)
MLVRSPAMNSMPASRGFRAARLACLLLAWTFSALAAERPLEPRVVTLLDLFAQHEAAILSGQARSAICHPEFVYTEPNMSAPGTSDAQRPVRWLGDSHFDRTHTFVSFAGPVAILRGPLHLDRPGATPRFEGRGQFSATFVETPAGWQLVAEHRSADPYLAAAAEFTPESIAQAKARSAQLEREARERRLAGRRSDPTPSAKSVAAGTDAPSNSDSDELRVHRGILPRHFTDLFRAYEPNRLGYTWDEGDDAFLDFTFSTMFPLGPRSHEYPEAMRREKGAAATRALHLAPPQLYFAGTLRAGQYLGTRPSSPVVGKRFNPVVAVRFWALDRAARGHRFESEDNFFEFVYGHESNGQFIASEQRLKEQVRVYENQAFDVSDAHEGTLAKNSAGRAARDNLSRGWDYVGFQFARDWDALLSLGRSAQEVTVGLRLRFNYYLANGVAQGRPEQYRWWEGEPVDKPRKNYDGLSLRYTVVTAPARARTGPDAPAGWRAWVRPDRRYALTLTTGYRSPFEHLTVQAEASLVLFKILPLTAWVRYGYNSDLVDYYRKDRSVGLSLSYWSF